MGWIARLRGRNLLEGNGAGCRVPLDRYDVLVSVHLRDRRVLSAGLDCCRLGGSRIRRGQSNGRVGGRYGVLRIPIGVADYTARTTWTDAIAVSRIDINIDGKRAFRRPAVTKVFGSSTAADCRLNNLAPNLRARRKLGNDTGI